MKFLNKIALQAMKNQKTIILPESSDERILHAASIIQKEGLAKIILLSEHDQISSFKKNTELLNANIISTKDDAFVSRYAEAFYQLRKDKGVTKEKALELVKDPILFGIMMVKLNEADGMVAGAIHSTADTLRPALQILKTAPNINLVSTFFVMEVPQSDFGNSGTFVFSDCALNENPSAEQLADIAISSAKSYESFVGGTPKVAMLSYSTFGSAKSSLVDKVITATKIAKTKAPDLQIDGELQLDAAIIPSIGKFKAPLSPIAGDANVLIFPDLNAGNIGYKLVQRLAKANAYGPITQGISKPVNDLSRGCSVEDIVGVVAMTAVQAQTLNP